MSADPRFGLGSELLGPAGTRRNLRYALADGADVGFGLLTRAPG